MYTYPATSLSDKEQTTRVCNTCKQRKSVAGFEKHCFQCSACKRATDSCKDYRAAVCVANSPPTERIKDGQTPREDHAESVGLEYPTGIRGDGQRVSGSNGRRNRTRESREVEDAGRSGTADPPKELQVISPQTASSETIYTSGDTQTDIDAKANAAAMLSLLLKCRLTYLEAG